MNLRAEGFPSALFFGSSHKSVGTPIKTSQVKAELLREGRDMDSALKGALYHSSLGISNEEAMRDIGIIELEDL